ncbi:MAG: leucyl aminopeptidase [Vicinamibacterales bacterium]
MNHTPEFVGITTGAAAADVDLLFVPVFEDDDRLDDLPGLDAATSGDLAHARESGEFRGRLFETFIARASQGDYKAAKVALVGAGRRADADPERLRRVAAACSYTARLRSMRSAGLVVRSGLDVLQAAQMGADGMCAAEFDSGTYKSDRDAGEFPSRIVIIAPGADQAALDAAVFRGRTLGESANRARALANEPANVLTPTEFANRVEAMATEVGLSVDVLDEHRIRELKMGLLLGVAQGSAEPPRLVVIRHDPPGAPESPVLGFVGKGVTFDTGGVSIKPADGMERMKDDMAGGAAVAAAMRALALLKVPRRVIGVIPMTENMVGGKATRPGDVLTGASGTTVEIINTDAEGRLILGDALWYAQQLGATHLVDIATLTGACMVALGRTASGLFATPDTWLETVKSAGQDAGDRLWPLPLYDEYREMIRSEIADIINSAGRWAGAITAAVFLREFVKDGRPWAHLDIAGTAWAEDRRAYQAKGATGVAVRTLVELASCPID